MSKSRNSLGTESSGDRPPFGSWRLLYGVVLGELALLILLFYLFTKAFE
jgi:hypothetical protein